MKQISESIGHDGQHFFCLRCGKSGYTKMAQVRGHLAMCPGTAIRKGAVPTGHNSVVTAPQANLQEPCCEPVPTGYNPVTGAFSGTSSGVINWQQQQQQFGARLARLENEAHHMMLSRNQPEPVGDWLSRNKGIIILGAIALFAVMIMNQNRQCPSASGSSGVKSIGNVGEKALMKLMDRGISKGVDSLFK